MRGDLIRFLFSNKRRESYHVEIQKVTFCKILVELELYFSGLIHWLDYVFQLERYHISFNFPSKIFD